MRIPLDYYRILSIPVKATEQQLEQACSDRLLQQPRREYNEQAISARQSLIEQAYQILSDSEQRAEYDAQFLISMQPVATAEVPVEIPVETEPTESDPTERESTELVESAENSEENGFANELENLEIADVPVVTPTIEIEAAQVVGALLILHELGEYELVLTLGIDYYNSQEFSLLQQKQEPEINVETQENLILSLALAYMELGREQWHRQEYEPAAVSSQLGIDLLNQENLFPQVKQELELDLDKLRPYRVLELISQNLPNSAPRAQGFQLLQNMLVQREGIEGKGQDRSGLSFDQFLCFIQQLRTYLTSTEQQQLFDNNIHNDSAIASYLAVFALLGRGFHNQQPELILRAQRKLDYLSVKQDVTWEQSVCALLLGHTEKAISKVHQSQDTSKLNQILQHSPGSADLLPGMCFYGEQWLHEDVLSQFVDLVDTKLPLKEYFANSEVQAYLEELTPATALGIPNGATIPSTEEFAADDHVSQANSVAIFSRWRNLFSTAKTASAKTTSQPAAISTPVNEAMPELVGAGVANTTTVNGKKPSQVKAFAKHNSPKKPKQQKIIQPQKLGYQKSPKAKPKSLSLPLQAKNRAVPSSVMNKAAGKAKHQKKSKKKANTVTIVKGWLFIIGLIFGAVTLGYIATKLFLNPTQKTAKKAQLAIAMTQPNIEIPPVKAKPVVAKPKLTLIQESQRVIDNWLVSKSAAFGKEHKIAELDSILAEPLLATWRDRATDYQEGDFYREYQHQVKMRSAKVDPQNPNEATVEAEVKEQAQHYQSGQLDNTQSYDDNLLVRYQLVRKGEKWMIKNAEVLETL